MKRPSDGSGLDEEPYMHCVLYGSRRLTVITFISALTHSPLYAAES